MQIHVTQEDINKGEICIDRCPLALALQRQLNPNTRVALARYSPSGSFTDCQCLPEEAIRFRARFDESLPVEPFTFELPTL